MFQERLASLVVKWLHALESGPEFKQGTGSVTMSLTLLVPSWCGAGKMSEVAENCEIFRDLLVLLLL